MNQDYRLFELLSDGEFHSGELIAKEFGVSRSRVWALINSLEKKGVQISRVRGRGYRYGGGSKLIDTDYLRQALAGIDLHYSVELESTNEFARTIKPKQCALVLTEYQTSGKGRRGRQWSSGFGQNLMFTMKVNEYDSVHGLEGLSLVVGHSIVTAVDNALGLNVQVKWPNDILYKDNKIAGVLIEIQGDLTGACNLMIGVGLNVNDEPELVDRKDVTSLKGAKNKTINRTGLLLNIVKQIQIDLARFQASGFTEFKDSWNAFDAYRGQVVMVTQGDRKIVGVSKGVNDKGALILVLEGSEELLVHGGEVSLRKLND